MNLKIIIIIILVVTLLLYCLCPVIEKFDTHTLTPQELRKNKEAWFIHGQEYSKLDYMRPPVSKNNTTKLDIPVIDYINEKTPINVRQILRHKYMKQLFEKNIINKTSDADYQKFSFYIHDQPSWQNKDLDLTKDMYVDYQIKNSKYKIVDKMILKVYDIVKEQFIIYKYAIGNVFIDKKTNHKKFGLLIVLLQEYGLYGYTIYLRGFEQNGEIILDSYDLVGNAYTEDLFLKNGYDNEMLKEHKYLEQPDKMITPNTFIDVIKKKPKQWGCFSIKTGNLVRAINKMDCESAYDLYGRKKEVGMWDKPCEKDNECFFYKSNKNYPNNFGKCSNGYCQMPNNIKKIGYKYFDPKIKPQCYNCGNKKWFVISPMDTCCDTQKNKFKSPDYAFKDDVNKRFNYFKDKNYKVNRYKIKNIVDE